MGATKTQLCAALLASALVPAAAWGRAGKLDQAIQDYNSRHYGAAAAKLSGCDQHNPLVHYYLALSYQAAGNYAGARKEYMWGYQNSSDKRLRYQSWQGLQGLSALSATRSAPAQSAPPQAVQTTTASSKPMQLTDINGKPVSSDPKQWFHTQWKAGCPRHQ